MTHKGFNMLTKFPASIDLDFNKLINLLTCKILFMVICYKTPHSLAFKGFLPKERAIDQVNNVK